MKHTLRVAYYVRYTDDFVIVHHERKYLEQTKNEIESFLKCALRLELHPHKVSIRKYRQGIDFLGYVELPRARIVRTKTRRRIFRKIQLLAGQYRQKNITQEQFKQSINSYLAVLKHANTFSVRQDLKQKLYKWLRDPND